MSLKPGDSKVARSTLGAWISNTGFKHTIYADLHAPPIGDPIVAISIVYTVNEKIVEVVTVDVNSEMAEEIYNPVAAMEYTDPFGDLNGGSLLPNLPG